MSMDNLNPVRKRSSSLEVAQDHKSKQYVSQITELLPNLPPIDVPSMGLPHSDARPPSPGGGAPHRNRDVGAHDQAT